MKINMPAQAAKVIKTLEEHGFEAYIVGGCVRDSILGRTPGDWDITTSASPQEVKEIFEHTVDTGIEHGTVTVLMNHEPYEVTTYRVDGKYEDHRRPNEVHFTKSLKEDLLRRDFTINAMAYNDREGIIDMYDGMTDLKNKMIRCVGEATKRFDEDALRILRALRFQAQLGFEIEEKTEEAIRNQARFLKDISAERIQVELEKLITSAYPEVLVNAYKLGVTKIIFPEFDIMMETPQNNPHHKYSVGIHTIEAMKNIEAEHIYRWTMLLHDIGKPEARVEGPDKDHFKMHPVIGEEIARKILRRLKFDNQTIKQVTTLVRWHDRRFASFEEVNKKTIRRWVSKLTPELFARLMVVQRADINAQSDYHKEQKEQEQASMQEKLEAKEKELRRVRKTAREVAERKQKHESRGEKQSVRKGIPRIMMGGLKENAEKSASKLKEVHEDKMENLANELKQMRSSLPDLQGMKLDFSASGLHEGKILVTAKEINFGYAEAGDLWPSPMSFQIKSGERWLIQGDNGSGKTTLLKLITGQLPPRSGSLIRADFSSIYIDQEYSIVRNDRTVYEQAQAFNERHFQEHEIKTLLNRFLFPHDTWEKSCGKLSGGEKMRLAFCCLMISNQTPDLFILDEPTNNLDIQSIEIITSMVRVYRGTILLISHDAYFIRELGIHQIITTFAGRLKTNL